MQDSIANKIFPLYNMSFSVKALLRRSSRSEGFDTPSATQPDGDVSRPSVSLENAAHWVSILISIRLRLLNPSRYSVGLSSRRHIEINRRSLTEKLVFTMKILAIILTYIRRGFYERSVLWQRALFLHGRLIAKGQFR
jgi:hypothetical protein